MDFIKLTIVTICLNDKEGLEKTILSVRTQSFKNYEHIIIDGGSVDNSLEVIDKYKDGFSYHTSEKDTGRYNAMNKGIEKALGEYCLFLNSGDFLADQDVLSKLFAGNPSSKILYGDLIISHQGLNTILKQPDFIDLDYLMKCTVLHPASVVSTKLLKYCNGYNESYKIAGDYDFFLKIIFMCNASSEYRPISFAVYNLDGISADPKYAELTAIERKRAQTENIPQLVIKYYDLKEEQVSSKTKIKNYLRKFQLIILIEKIYLKVFRSLF